LATWFYESKRLSLSGFVGMNGGKHIIFDACNPKDARWMASETFIRAICLVAARAAKATVLDTKFHDFGEGHGITGVVLLAESHISVHTFPEVGLACFDVFMCGNCDPELAVASIVRNIDAQEVHYHAHERRAPPLPREQLRDLQGNSVPVPERGVVRDFVSQLAAWWGT
jgi:S-adenosylmethionine decarboxylase